MTLNPAAENALMNAHEGLYTGLESLGIDVADGRRKPGFKPALDIATDIADKFTEKILSGDILSIVEGNMDENGLLTTTDRNGNAVVIDMSKIGKDAKDHMLIGDVVDTQRKRIINRVQGVSKHDRAGFADALDQIEYTARQATPVFKDIYVNGIDADYFKRG